MIAVILFNLFAIFFAWLESIGRNKHGLKYAMFIVFLFFALRYNFGNDYMAYLASFQEIKESGSDYLDFVKPKYEIGWVFLNHFFAPLGFFVMLGFLAVINCTVLYYFIKKYVPSQYYWFAIFIYMFQPYNMLVLSSGMRQAVSVTIFLLAIDFLINRKIVIYLILILIASLFHSSAYLLFPLMLLSIIKWTPSIFTFFATIVVFLIPTLWGDFVLDKMNIIISSLFPYYGHYDKQAVLNSGLGFLLTVFFFLITLYFNSKIEDEKLLLFRLAIISFLLIPLSFGLALTSRLNFYFQPVFMIVYPTIIINMKKNGLKIIFMGLIILSTFYEFFKFFQSDVWHKAFSDYHTIFSAPVFY